MGPLAPLRRSIDNLKALHSERDLIAARIDRLQLKKEATMAGEIRTKMEALRAARAAMVSTMGAEIDKVTADIAATHQDGLAALALPKAELDSFKQEIQEIRAEFKTVSNGGPAGPLPDAPAPSAVPSATSAPSPAPAPAPATIAPAAAHRDDHWNIQSAPKPS